MSMGGGGKSGILMTLGERRISMCALENWQLKFQGGGWEERLWQKYEASGSAGSM